MKDIVAVCACIAFVCKSLNIIFRVAKSILLQQLHSDYLYPYKRSRSFRGRKVEGSKIVAEMLALLKTNNTIEQLYSPDIW